MKINAPIDTNKLFTKYFPKGTGLIYEDIDTTSLHSYKQAVPEYKFTRFPMREYIETIVPDDKIPEEFPLMEFSAGLPRCAVDNVFEIIIGAVVTAFALIGIFYFVQDILGII